MGTQAKADKKSEIRFDIAFTIIGCVIMGMTFFDWGHTHLYDYFRRAGTGFQIAGIVCHLVSLGWLWLANVFFAGGTKIHPGVLWLGFLVLGFLFCAGFNFDLHGIEPGA